MGYGDRLMSLGAASLLQAADHARRRVAIGAEGVVDTEHRDLAWGLGGLLATQASVDGGEDVLWLDDGRNRRPYIDYDAMWAEAAERKLYVSNRAGLVKALNHYIWKPHKPEPAPIVLTLDECALAREWSAKRPFVVLEPYVKPSAPPSKQWDPERFHKVAKRLAREVPVYQLSAPGRATLPGLPRIEPKSFREAMAYLRAASLYVGPEGGLHHAAAAMGTPAVVVFGGFISPAVTGYDFHTNLTGDTGGRFCGTRTGACPHCVTALESITVDAVHHHARQHLGLI